jgi:hypothetical protein
MPRAPELTPIAVGAKVGEGAYETGGNFLDNFIDSRGDPELGHPVEQLLSNTIAVLSAKKAAATPG